MNTGFGTSHSWSSMYKGTRKPIAWGGEAFKRKITMFKTRKEASKQAALLQAKDAMHRYDVNKIGESNLSLVIDR